MAAVAEADIQNAHMLGWDADVDLVGALRTRCYRQHTEGVDMDRWRIALRTVVVDLDSCN